MNTDTLDIRPLEDGEEPHEDEVLVVGSRKQMRLLKKNLEKVKRKARKTAKSSRKKNRS